jgi:hypothetical protein
MRTFFHGDWPKIPDKAQTDRQLHPSVNHF